MDKKNVLVTGSSIGLGKSIIEKFAKNNYNCIINYVHHEKEAKELKEKIEKEYNVICDTIKCDITNDNEVKELYNFIMNKYNKLDVLVNNAGIAIDEPIEVKTKENFMKTLEVNLYGTFNVSKIFASSMYNNKNGVIINIASTNGIDSYYEFSIDYDASKAGVINLTHNLANIYSPFVRVNAVCPGWINTPMNKNLSEEFKNKEIDKILLKRFSEPNEIASLVYFLATDEASYINDSIIKIDGGRKC